MARHKPVISDALTLNCHVDHAVIGLMDPAHGPYVHRQWWWRSEHSIHEKAKAFEPRERTAVTPIDDHRTEIRQIFFTDMMVVKLLSPVIKLGARKFLRQDAHMVDLQQMGLKFDPTLMLIEDADTQAKWYHAIKREWAKSNAQGRAFDNPVKAKTLKWRS